MVAWGDDVVTNFLQFYSLCSQKESVSFSMANNNTVYLVGAKQYSVQTGKWPTLLRWWTASNNYLCLGLLVVKEVTKILFFSGGIATLMYSKCGLQYVYKFILPQVFVSSEWQY